MAKLPRPSSSSTIRISIQQAVVDTASGTMTTVFDRHVIRLAAVIAMSALMCACGGGGTTPTPTPTPTAADAPIVSYTDIVSGPVTGGEGNGGAYLSIFGKNFGAASGMGTVTKVFIGATEVASYRYMGVSKADALFTAAGTDFHLKGGSPAIGAGVVTTLVTDDLGLKSRGSSNDLGAWQH